VADHERRNACNRSASESTRFVSRSHTTITRHVLLALLGPCCRDPHCRPASPARTPPGSSKRHSRSGTRARARSSRAQRLLAFTRGAAPGQQRCRVLAQMINGRRHPAKAWPPIEEEGNRSAGGTKISYADQHFIATSVHTVHTRTPFVGHASAAAYALFHTNCPFNATRRRLYASAGGVHHVNGLYG